MSVLETVFVVKEETEFIKKCFDINVLTMAILVLPTEDRRLIIYVCMYLKHSVPL